VAQRWSAGAKGAGSEVGHAGGEVARYIVARTPSSPRRTRQGGAAAGVMVVEAMASGLAKWASCGPVAGPCGDGSERVGPTSSALKDRIGFVFF
jgi:hypothetical protein